MKQLTTTICLLLLFASAYCQKETSKIKSSNEVFAFVEYPPEFPGGDKALMAFLQANTHPPKLGVDSSEKKVLIKFVVTETGKVGEVTVEKSSSFAALDSEAVRVVKSLPDFKPGRTDGRPVKVYYNLPFIFRM